MTCREIGMPGSILSSFSLFFLFLFTSFFSYVFRSSPPLFTCIPLWFVIVQLFFVLLIEISHCYLFFLKLTEHIFLYFWIDYLVDEGTECNATSDLLLERTRELSIVDLLVPTLVLLITLLQKLQVGKLTFRNHVSYTPKVIVKYLHGCRLIITCWLVIVSNPKAEFSFSVPMLVNILYCLIVNLLWMYLAKHFI